MISKQDVEKLSGLARISLTEEEKSRFQGEIEAILGYVGKVKEMSDAAPEVQYAQINNLREDVVLHKTGEYTERLLEEAPEREGDFVKVKKILE